MLLPSVSKKAPRAPFRTEEAEPSYGAKWVVVPTDFLSISIPVLKGR